jgi:hypothetical protein
LRIFLSLRYFEALERIYQFYLAPGQRAKDILARPLPFSGYRGIRPSTGGGFNLTSLCGGFTWREVSYFLMSTHFLHLLTGYPDIPPIPAKNTYGKTAPSARGKTDRRDLAEKFFPPQTLL